jgi:hypothetical protein
LLLDLSCPDLLHKFPSMLPNLSGQHILLNFLVLFLWLSGLAFLALVVGSTCWVGWHVSILNQPDWWCCLSYSPHFGCWLVYTYRFHWFCGLLFLLARCPWSVPVPLWIFSVPICTVATSLVPSNCGYFGLLVL